MKFSFSGGHESKTFLQYSDPEPIDPEQFIPCLGVAPNSQTLGIPTDDNGDDVWVEPSSDHSLIMVWVPEDRNPIKLFIYAPTENVRDLISHWAALDFLSDSVTDFRLCYMAKKIQQLMGTKFGIEFRIAPIPNIHCPCCVESLMNDDYESEWWKQYCGHLRKFKQIFSKRA